MVTDTYIGLQGGDWFNPANWTSRTVPTSGGVADLFGVPDPTDQSGLAGVQAMSGTISSLTIDLSGTFGGGNYVNAIDDVYGFTPSLTAQTLGCASEPVAIEVTGDSGMPGEPGILVGTLEGSINVAAQQALTIGDGATIDGNITIGVGASLSFTGYNYYFYDDPTVTLNGLVALEGGTLAVQSNALTGNGAIEIGQGGALVITNGATFAPSISLDITFDPSGGTFSNIMYGASYTGTIHGFGAGDSIFISDEFSRFYSFSTSYADGVLTITPFEQSSEQIHFTGSYTIGNFDVQLAAGSSIEITYAPCFATGTLITTPTGHRRVETLAAGDTVSLASGTTARVIWLGHRRQIDGDVIRIRQHALGHHTPNRDLVVSADHGMFLDGVLVQAGLLVNGETILREHRDEVVLWHVEVERHGILLAEGAAAESYLDTGNRRQFGNCPLAYDPIHDMQELCAEMVFAGERLKRIRARLSIVA